MERQYAREEKYRVLRVLSNLTGEGRLNTSFLGEKIIGIVDYAHTPDALLNVWHRKN